MKKLFFTMAVIAGAMFFASCDDETVQEVMTEITGKAAVVVGEQNDGDEEVHFSASMAMTKEGTEKANPYTIGLAMSMSINDLLNIRDSNAIIFPMMAYRITGRVSQGASYTVENYLTTDDVLDFDYRSLFNGKFAGAQLVGIAMSKTKFYVMKTGTIDITEVTTAKICGTFSGTAYTIDREQNPSIDVHTSVPFSGSFQSRLHGMITWIEDLQEEGNGPQGE